jgi:hypothetical protein
LLVCCLNRASVGRGVMEMGKEKGRVADKKEGGGKGKERRPKEK